MADFLLLSVFFISVLELISFFSIIVEEIIFINNFYLFLLLFIFTYRFFISFKKEKFNFNIDLITRYYLFFFKKPNFFINFFYNTLKQIYIYYFFFKYKFSYETFKVILKGFTSKISLIWRPLFKKFSYFGYFRANRSKWIK